MTVLVWFRQDLRLHDNLVVHNALKYSTEGHAIIPIYIQDPKSRIGAASDWWLEQSLQALNQSIDYSLSIYAGCSEDIIKELICDNKISHVLWNKCYNPIQNQIDNNIATRLIEQGIEIKTYNSTLLWDPADQNLLNKQNMPYQVFTHFYKNAINYPPRKAIQSQHISSWTKSNTKSYPYSCLQRRKWHQKFNMWHIGEKAALDKLDKFLMKGIFNYKDGRNNLNYTNVSMLSPHIHFGEISPNYIWQKIKQCEKAPERDKEHFCSELGWREFAHYMTHHFSIGDY